MNNNNNGVMETENGTTIMTPLESAGSNSNQLLFLDRELFSDEIAECEKAAREYVANDNYEIEIHNLNEVNEYFRIFKDDIIKKELKN